MALEGVCEIELRDEQGNVVQRTKDKNMITNGLSNTVNLDCEMVKRLFSIEKWIENQTKTTPVLQKIIGGIFLFNEVQDENVNNIVPNFSKLVGTASLSKTVSNNSMVGMWNEDESNVIYNNSGDIIGIKFVFDFPTDRANGSIKSVSLTTDIGARDMLKYPYCFSFFSGSSTNINTNYYFNKINPVQEILNRNQSDSIAEYRPYGKYNEPYIVTITKNREIVVVHSVDTSSKTFVLRKYSEKNEIGLNNTLVQSTNIFNEKSFNLLQEKTIDYSDVYLDSVNKNIIIGSIYCYGEHIYVTYGYRKNIIIKKISISDFNIVEKIQKTFENGGINDNHFTSSSSSCRAIFIYGNYYVASQYIKGDSFVSLLFINKDDMTIAKKISYELYSSDKQTIRGQRNKVKI